MSQKSIDRTNEVITTWNNVQCEHVLELFQARHRIDHGSGSVRCAAKFDQTYLAFVVQFCKVPNKSKKIFVECQEFRESL